MTNDQDQNNRIQCRIDLASGTAEISAPPEYVDEVFQKAQDLAATLAEHSRPFHATANAAGPTAIGGLDEDLPKPAQSNKKAANQSARTPGGSAARLGRIGSFERVGLGFTEEQERGLLAFYAEKKPKEQTDKVATAMYFGERELGRQAFTYNEIYTLLHLGGEKSLPKALDVVMGKMFKENWVSRDPDGYSLKFLARDHVEQKLPA